MQEAKKRLDEQRGRSSFDDKAKRLQVAVHLSESLAGDKPKASRKGGILSEIDQQKHRLDG